MSDDDGTLACVDFLSHEPCLFERRWRAVAVPTTQEPRFDVDLMTPDQVLLLHDAVLAELFQRPGEFEAAKARAQALQSMERAQALQSMERA